MPAPEVNGGALAMVGEKVLLLTGDGLIYSLEISTDGERMDVLPMGYQSPMNTVEFREQARGLSHGQQAWFRAKMLTIRICEKSCRLLKNRMLNYEKS